MPNVSNNSWFVFSIAVHVWCDEIRDIRLWPSNLYSKHFIQQFISALSNFDDDNYIDIKQQVQNSSWVFSLKHRFPLDMAQIKIKGTHMICKGPVCLNEPPAIVMVHSPA